MQPDGFIQSADWLLSTNDSKEAPTAGDVRSAISRAYYAIFLTARSLARDAGLNPDRKDENEHENVYLLVNNCGVPDLEKTVAKTHKLLRRLRREADYELVAAHVENPAAARTYLDNAKQAVHLLKIYASRAQQGMAKYNKDRKAILCERESNALGL